jgi:hypothetical protein
MLAVLPNVIHVYGADHQLRWKDEPMHEPRPVVRVMFLDRDWFFLDASADRAMRVGVWWYWYGRLWWVLALVAGLIVVREFLPIPRLFGRDDDDVMV